MQLVSPVDFQRTESLAKTPTAQLFSVLFAVTFTLKSPLQQDLHGSALRGLRLVDRLMHSNIRSVFELYHSNEGSFR